ncbi:sensor histidine kinase [Methylocapsa palsarum]|uniref:sensor histidine kinase n=1 Tax=Methylocapsa palsarum TaxID=1612308 RepID=UPI000B86AB75|nr:HAMP domain-containing sensor histidine kinase [Methylocapsa palsarum]
MVGHLLAGLMAAYVLTILWLQFGELLTGSAASDLQWDDFSRSGTQALVARSLVRSPDGAVSIDPDPDLRAELERTPTLKYAAFDPETGVAAPGSSQELVAALGTMERLKPLAMTFRLGGENDSAPKGVAALRQTPTGRRVIAIYGYRFSWPMLLRNISESFGETFKYFLPTFAVAMGVGWLSLRRGLKPLRDAARQARQIDMKALDRRIDLTGIPSEILPLMTTINDALDRLAAGVERDRRFIANAAHELRTPITILSARIDAPRAPTFENDLKRDARRIRNIVEQLLVTSRLGRHGNGFDDDVDLAAAVQSVVDDYALLAIRNKQEIQFESGDAPVVVRGDRSAIESVVSNLVDNALRAEPEGGTVVVRVRPGAIIEIVDHGEGVAHCDRHVIFEPFWRKSEQTPGTGLGLAIVRELIELHGGTICVSETHGGGATFKVTL